LKSASKAKSLSFVVIKNTQNYIDPLIIRLKSFVVSEQAKRKKTE